MRFEPRAPADEINYSSRGAVRETMIQWATLSVAAVAAFLLLGWAVELAAPRVPPKWEPMLFGWMASAVEADEVDDSDRTAELQRLTDRLAAHWEGNPYALRAGVMEAPVANALALPGGRILVTRTLLDEVETETELAFVLGHELGHFRNRDHLRSIGRGMAGALVTSVIGAVTGLGAAPTLEPARGLADRGFSRAQETEADRFGLELVYREYGHVRGADGYFRRILAEEQDEGRPAAARWLSTHPLTERRLEALAAWAAERGWTGLGER